MTNKEALSDKTQLKLSRREWLKFMAYAAGTIAFGGFVQRLADGLQDSQPAEYIPYEPTVRPTDWYNGEFPQPTQLPPTVESTPQPIVVEQVEAPRLVDNYVLGDGNQEMDNLNAMRHRIMFIFRDEVDIVPFQAVRPFAYSGDTSQFNWRLRTIMSNIMNADQFTETWIHSGENMPADQFVRMIQNSPLTGRRTLEEIHMFIEANVVGREICILQDGEPGILPDTWPSSSDIGLYKIHTNMLPCRIKGVAFVTDVAGYESHAGRQVSWIQEGGSGSMSFGDWNGADPGTDFLLKTCFRNTPDQGGARDISRNRLMLLLTPRTDNDSDAWKNFDPRLFPSA